MWMIVGLGNPGDKYEATRHNVGFLVLDAVANTMKAQGFKAAFQGLAAKGAWAGHDVVVLKPQTFMNLSGTSVQAAAAFYRVPPAQIVVVHDELDLGLGIVRVKMGGGHGGHNGIKDIARVLGPDFVRVRVGIGRPPEKGNANPHVLGPFSAHERPLVEEAIGLAHDAALAVVSEGVLKAQEQFNRKA